MKRIAKLTCLLLAILLLAAVAMGCGKEKSSGTSSSAYKKWMDVLKDYDRWVDKYIAAYNKYKQNPNDTSALQDYTNLISEMTQWEAKMAAIDDDDDLTDAELAKVLAEYQRITAKLAKIAG